MFSCFFMGRAKVNVPDYMKYVDFGYEINKAERPHWIVFPWEEWDK